MSSDQQSITVIACATTTITRTTAGNGAARLVGRFSCWTLAVPLAAQMTM